MAFRLAPELKAKGEQAEADFRAWLDWSEVAYLYVEQSPFYVPESLRGHIKRPDFIVGLPLVGAMAFDVKAKAVKNGQLIFDLAEVEKLAVFARMFQLALMFVCMDAADPANMRWVRLDELQSRPQEWRRKARVVTMPMDQAYTVPSRMTFLQAYMHIANQSGDE